MQGKKERYGKPSSVKDKIGASVFALQHEEAPTVDTYAGMFSIAYYSVYAMVDTSASHSCISKECVHDCELMVEVLPRCDMRVCTPLGFGSAITRVGHVSIAYVRF